MQALILFLLLTTALQASPESKLVYWDDQEGHPREAKLHTLELLPRLEGRSREAIARQLVLKCKTAKQGGADQPATTPESESEGIEKLKPESEGRSR